MECICWSDLFKYLVSPKSSFLIFFLRIVWYKLTFASYKVRIAGYKLRDKNPQFWLFFLANMNLYLVILTFFLRIVRYKFDVFIKSNFGRKKKTDTGCSQNSEFISHNFDAIACHKVAIVRYKKKITIARYKLTIQRKKITIARYKLTILRIARKKVKCEIKSRNYLFYLFIFFSGGNRLPF